MPTFPHIAIIATLLLLTAAAHCQAAWSDVPGDPTDTLEYPYDIAPWPASDSLPMPKYQAYGERVRGGIVDVQLSVGIDGTVEKWDISTRQKGYGFEESVQKAISQWRFRPAKRDGNPVPARIQLKFVFRESERDLHDQPFVKCRSFAKVGEQEGTHQLYRPPVIVLCP